MKMRWLLSLGLLALVGCCIFFALRAGTHPRKYPRHVYITSNDNFRIRVQMFPEEGVGFVLGAYYVFQSADMDSDNWADIVTYKQDDPDPIPCDRIRFLGDKTAYVFMEQMFAVTSNNGRAWKVWDIAKDPVWHRAGIEDIQLSESGIGTMTLRIIGDNRAVLRTNDYGHHWNED
jgi:photosystem II stability/assembly factor-like uncharacterized protein